MLQPAPIESRGVTLQVTSAGQTRRSLGFAAVSESVTEFAYRNPQVMSECSVSLPMRSGRLSFAPESVSAIQGFAYDSGAGAAATLVMEAAGNVQISGGGDREERRIELNHAAISVASKQLAIVGDSDGVSYASVGQATFRTRYEASISLVATADDDAATVIESLGGAVDQIELPTDEDHRGEFLTVNLQSAPRRVVPNAKKKGERADNIYVSKGKTFFQLSLDNAEIVLRRGLDLLDMRFQFSGFDLRYTERGPYLWLPKKNTPSARITVLFPPQHLWETIHEALEACEATKGRSAFKYSGESRLVFRVEDRKRWKILKPTIKELTNWDGLIPIVDKRAEARRAGGIESQLEVPFGADANPFELGYDNAFSKIAGSFVAPDETNTALELVTDLIFSPSEEARWEVPGEPEDTKYWPLWNARLATGRQSVRAIWSKKLAPKMFGVSLEDCALGEGEADRAALDARRHWDIVAQTSLYGLPALRRRSNDLEGKDIPKSNVVRALLNFEGTTAPPAYLTDIENQSDENLKTGDAGIALASPFEDADITLTSVGAIMRASWRADPPKLLPLQGKKKYRDADGERDTPTAFSLEQLYYQTCLGRDIRVVAVDKGYLFPLGIRASFVTICERRFYPDEKGNPVSYEVERRFIDTGGRTKSYPGLNQPFDARDFPAARILMKTRFSPDLINPETTEGGKIPGIGEDARPTLCFWPRFKSPQSAAREFLFEWATEDVNSVRSALIFVENAVVANTVAMGALTEYYNGSASGEKALVELRSAKFFGARKRYAPIGSEYETSFDTADWILGAHTIPYMDARMEGADQPPFYPHVVNANITVQSVDRMLGASKGLVTVRHAQRYKQHGFASGQNNSEIFLEVLSPKIAFDVGGNSRASGGIAAPSAFVAAISRKTGLVGGRPKEDGDNPALMKVNGVKTDSAFEFEAAELGKFDPREAFASELPTLLGVVDLREAVLAGLGMSEAPKLVEDFVFGALEDGVNRIRAIARAAREPLETVSADVTRLLDAVIWIGGIEYHVRAFYPEFAKAADKSLPLIRREVRELENADGPAAVAVSAGAIATSAKPLVKEIERIAQDPAPAIFDGLDEVLNDWRSLADAVDILVNTEFSSQADGIIRNALTEPLCSTISEHPLFASCLFGAAVDCETLARDPRGALSRVSESLFAELYGYIIERLYRCLGSAVDEIEIWVNFSAERLRQEVEDQLRICESEIADTLRQYVKKEDATLLSDTKILETARVIATSVESFVAAQKPASEDRLDALEALPLRVLNSVGNLAKAELGKLINELPFPSKPQSLRGRVEQLFDRTAAATANAASSLVDLEVRRIRNEILRHANAAKGEAVGKVLGVVDAALQALLKSASFARVSKIGREADGWCEEARIAALAIGDGLISRAAELDEAVAALRDAAVSFDIYKAPLEIRNPLADARAKLLQSIDNLRLRLETLRVAREELVESATDCVELSVLMARLGDVMRLRRDAIASVADIIENVIEIDAIRDSPALRAAMRGAPTGPSFAAHIDENLDNVVNAVKAVLLGISTIAKVYESSDAWKSAKGAAIKLIRLIEEFDPEYAAELEFFISTGQNGFESLTREVHESLASATIGDIRARSEAVAAHAAAYDRRFAALIMQSAASFEAAEQDFLQAIKLLAGKLVPYSDSVALALGAVRETLKKNGAVVDFLLGAKAFPEFKKAFDAVACENDLIKQIAAAGDGEILGFAMRLADRWKANSPAMVYLIETFSLSVDSLMRAGLKDWVATEIKELAEGLRIQLQELVSEFLPTTVTTRYDWSTNLNSVPAARPIFWIDGERIENGADGRPKPHLVLSARAEANLLTRKTTFISEGVLQPFAIKLLPRLEMATIFFERMTFSSRNGGEPRFDVRVRNVEIGPLLKFIEPLQAWMSEKDNGVYIRPADGFDGLEAGYRFSSSEIRVGPLQFLDVSINVAAVLSFTRRPAQFIFSFGSSERPFLISAPPYGGGGYVKLTSEAGGKTYLSLSFVYGAVVALKFGPLSAHGRVIVGVAVTRSGEGTTLMAIFEASGEGRIACFSISVLIRITLVHYPNGEMSGYTELRFSFKIGFARFRYRVRSESRIKGGGANSGSAGSLLLGAAANPGIAHTPPATGKPPIAVATPDKAKDWLRYRRRINLQLMSCQ